MYFLISIKKYVPEILLSDKKIHSFLWKITPHHWETAQKWELKSLRLETETLRPKEER